MSSPSQYRASTKPPFIKAESLGAHHGSERVGRASTKPPFIKAESVMQHQAKLVAKLQRSRLSSRRRAPIHRAVREVHACASTKPPFIKAESSAFHGDPRSAQRRASTKPP